MRKKLKKSQINQAIKEGFPIYRAHRPDNIHIKFWCFKCCEYHLHGWSGLEPFELTPRVPHCNGFMDPNSYQRKWPFGEVDRNYYLFIETLKIEGK